MDRKKIIGLGFKFLALEYLLSSHRKVKKQVGLRKRILCLLRGFSAEKYDLYQMKNNDYKLYLSDYQRRKTAIINGRYSIILSDKTLFSKLFEKDNLTAETYGTINRGVILINDKAVSFIEFIDLIKDKKKLILKIFNGGGGKNIHRLNFVEETFFLNGNQIEKRDLKAFIGNLDNLYLINEHLEQADYAKEIYPNTVNSIRILTMIEPNTNKVIIPVAVHKFGSDKTGHADNVWRGGMTALIDIESGVLQKSALHLENNEKIKWQEQHPDTKVSVSGTRVPNWEAVKSKIIEVAKLANSFNIKYVGWDIVVTNNGIKLIEGNNCSDVNILQIHHPLLRDSEAVKFYRHYNIIRTT